MTTKIRKAIVGAGASALIAGALLAGTATGAFAATVAPTVLPAKTIAKGATGNVGAFVGNQIGTAQTGTVTLNLTAPANSIFKTPEVWGEDVNQGVPTGATSKRFTGAGEGCTISNAGKNMTCTGAITIPAAGNGKQSGVNFLADVTVQSSAADNTLYTDGDFNMTNAGSTISGGRTNLQYRTPVVANAPMVDPVIGGGAAAAGLLALGGIYLTRNRKNAATA
ncbi:hypothetical protein ACFRJ9_19590 [Paenarthrobacter sp. NPDC056912]|uniref:hypothetical protein n=1 Tax=Paenarthrobacter sp. NPDC056912 TaxID=3345965 RepID=UPI003672A831